MNFGKSDRRDRILQKFADSLERVDDKRRIRSSNFKSELFCETLSRRLIYSAERQMYVEYINRTIERVTQYNSTEAEIEADFFFKY